MVHIQCFELIVQKAADGVRTHDLDRGMVALYQAELQPQTIPKAGLEPAIKLVLD